MVSYAEILESLRVFGPLTTRELKKLLKRNERDLTFLMNLRKLLRTLEARGMVRRVGMKKHSIIWELTRTQLNFLKRHNIQSFYESPIILRSVKAKHELKRFE